MKQLIYRDIYLIRKNLLVIFGIFLAFFLCGFIAFLSARYGNIAKYSKDGKFIDEVIDVSRYFAVMGAVLLGTAVEDVTRILHKDYAVGWHWYMKATHFTAEKIVGAKFILIYALNAISFVLGILSFTFMEHISGRTTHAAYPVLAAGSIFLVLTGSFYTVLEYVYKGKNSKKADLIRICPIIILMITGLLLSTLMLDAEKKEKLFEIVDSVVRHKVLLYVVVLLTSFLISVICYLISVRLVKREGKCK